MILHVHFELSMYIFSPLPCNFSYLREVRTNISLAERVFSKRTLDFIIEYFFYDLLVCESKSVKCPTVWKYRTQSQFVCVLLTRADVTMSQAR